MLREMRAGFSQRFAARTTSAIAVVNASVTAPLPAIPTGTASGTGPALMRIFG